MKLSKREFILLAFLGILIYAAGYYFLLYAPMQTRLDSLNDSIKQKEEALAATSIMISNWNDLSNKKEQISGDWDSLIGNLPIGFDDAEFMVRVQKILSPHTESVELVFPEAGTEGLATSIFPVELTFATQYKPLQSILKSFADADEYSRINNISCEEIITEDGDSNLNITMIVELYRRK